MISWEAYFFLAGVGLVGMIGLTLLRAVGEWGWRVYNKRARKRDATLPW